MTRRKDPAATRTPVAEMEAAGHALPQFEPVPRKYRHDGWTPERQKAFIAALADTGSERVPRKYYFRGCPLSAPRGP